ncbi:two-component system, NarL family, sensor histidine kinase DesK [Micromonospora echinaurantiaca]|uniref:Two-component system, NarL family, sensor histidine kinase DesK n=1 Tax=Micromonospora echinaurantiaca TaxID=47857 RepID=A0A1C5HJ22_9ACTN|nr:sensor histidine kinase [Micromonospora echinaurantiaca]SCG45521.1 two-component system, NarL family, sensor histidine kinase DesK [Micromonospora echinaurantiaca]
MRDTYCTEPQPAVAWFARHPGPWFALVWAPLLLTAPLVAAVADGRLPRAGHVVVVGVGYAYAVWLPFRSRTPRWRAEVVAAVLVLLVTAYLVLWRTDRQFVFPLLAIAVAVAVRPRWALGTIASLTLSGALAAGMETGSVDTALSLGFATFFGGVGTFLVYHLLDLAAELRRTRERLARAAVDEERLRFSRDLHDLLGHTLSVMVVSAQAVRRLAERDPAAAAEHARDIETTGRRALTEVRQAVTGYRSVRLDDELAGARTALAAGNVRLDLTPPAVPLDADVDSLLGWVVREGTTNVLRHARARTCRIAVTSDGSTVTVEIVDDGREGPAGEEGSGLHGLRERVEDLGGELIASRTPSGFRLAASVPVGSR